MPAYDFPLWFELLLLAGCAGFLALSGIGIYYLISKKFDKIALIISALILFILVVPKSLNPYSWMEIIKIYSNFISLTGLALSFFAIFSVINFIYRLIIKVNLS
jgi:hypothetical protein